MATEALACPSCRAPGPTGPDGHGEYLCIYCGTRFHRAAPSVAAGPLPTVANVVAPAPVKTAANPGALIVVAAGAVIMMAAAVILVFMATSRSDTESVMGPSGGDPIEVPPIGAAEHHAPHTASAPAAKIEAPAPEVPATANFEFHRIQSGYQTSFYVLAYITNTSPFIIDKPKVTAVLLDAEGKEVGTDFGFAERDVLGPEERSPIKILVKDPPEHAQIRYEMSLRKASYIPKQAEGLRLEPGPAKPARFGKLTYELEGKVFNEGSSPAKFVQIEITALDAEGKLVGIGMTFADADVLAPGASARWHNSLMLADTPDHFEFAVSNRLAD